MNNTETTLIAYFAEKGKETNGRDADIAEGLSEKLKEKGVEAAKFAIVPVEIYPDDAQEKAVITKREHDARVRPAIVGKYSGMRYVKNLILIAPNWYNSVPQAVFTFFDNYDFSGKKVMPVIHHSGDGVDEVTGQLRHFLQAVDVYDAIDIDDAQDCESQCPVVIGKLFNQLGLE